MAESQAGVLPRRRGSFISGLGCPEGICGESCGLDLRNPAGRGGQSPGQCLPSRKAPRRWWRGWTWQSGQSCE